MVETDRIDTIADGVAGRCPIVEVLDDLLVVLDEVLLVREESIKAGLRALGAAARPARTALTQASAGPASNEDTLRPWARRWSRVIRITSSGCARASLSRA